MAAFGLTLSIAFAGPAAGDGHGLTEAQRSEMERVVREVLRNNPEIVVEAIEAVRAKQEEARRIERKMAVVINGERLNNDPTSPVGGNPQGDVTVVEFFDYQCPYCKRIFASVATLLKSDSNVRYVFKEYPILGRESGFAARAALAAWNLDPDKYMGFHAALMTARGGLTEERTMRIAAESGFDTDRLREAMAEPGIEAALQANFALAEALMIVGTPTFVIGEEVISGAAVNLDHLKWLVVQARKD